MPRLQTIVRKVSTSVRLTPEARLLLEQLALRGGVARSAVLETLIRREARRLGVDGQ